MSSDDDSPVRRRRGDRLVASLLDATLAELAAAGYSGLTMSAVARRAGTSKPVLYRRWPTRAHLVFAALDHAHRETVRVHDSGSLQTDLVELLMDFVEQARLVPPDIVWGLLAESAADPALSEQVRKTIQDSATGRAIADMVQNARRRGELGGDALGHDLLELPVTLVRYRLLLGAGATREDIDRLVEEVVMPTYKSACSRAD